MTVRSIGELIEPIMARAIELAGIQALLAGVHTDAGKKRQIIDWCCRGMISAEDAGLLITAYMLEDA